jgi:hypothetical protein
VAEGRGREHGAPGAAAGHDVVTRVEPNHCLVVARPESVDTPVVRRDVGVRGHADRRNTYAADPALPLRRGTADPWHNLLNRSHRHPAFLDGAQDAARHPRAGGAGVCRERDIGGCRLVIASRNICGERCSKRMQRQAALAKVTAYRSLASSKLRRNSWVPAR